MTDLTSAALDIDLSAIESNYRFLTSLAGEGTEIAAVVKSDAYGLGLERVTQTLSSVGCRHFFVANIEEALVIRSLCPDASIIAFSMDIAASRRIIREARLIPTVNSEAELSAVLEDRDPVPYFLNVETGFSRFGLHVGRLAELLEAGSFDRAPPLCLFTHLACSDEPNNPLNEEQRQRFAAATALFPKARKSLSASAGLWLGRSFHLDLARAGSALLGLNNARVFPNPLAPVVRLRAPLVEIRDIPRHVTIGYGATFRTQRKTTLGIVSIGYKHGLPWACANKLVARVAGFSAPVVGRIAMEFTTVDLTDVPAPVRQRGTVIDFLYEGFGIDEMAAAAGVSGQEVLVRLGVACRRNYVANAIAGQSVKDAPRRWGLPRLPMSKVA